MTVVRCGGKKGAGYCGNFNLAGSADDFGILAVYFGVKLVAVAFRLWTPRHRSLTLDEAQLKGWRRACALESAGLACLWLGLCWD